MSEVASLVYIQPLDDVSNVEFSTKIEHQQHNVQRTSKEKGNLVTFPPNICGLASTDFLFLLSLASWTNF